jgi:hypothetical protein
LASSNPMPLEAPVTTARGLVVSVMQSSVGPERLQDDRQR